MTIVCKHLCLNSYDVIYDVFPFKIVLLSFSAFLPHFIQQIATKSNTGLAANPFSGSTPARQALLSPFPHAGSVTPSDGQLLRLQPKAHGVVRRSHAHGNPTTSNLGQQALDLSLRPLPQLLAWRAVDLLGVCRESTDGEEKVSCVPQVEFQTFPPNFL